MLSDLFAGWAGGPADERFTSVLLGVRGSGKTVLLSEIEDRAARNGWIVMSLDGVADGLMQRVSEMTGQVARSHHTPGLEVFDGPKSKERTSGVKIGPYQRAWAEKELLSGASDMGARERLTVLAEAAQQSDSAVLLTLDELHSANQNDARRLASDIQHITKRAQLPLALVGAGLLELKFSLMEGKKNTFFKRCNTYELAPLSYADALEGIASPIRASGGRIASEALIRAAEATNGSPYRMQLIGHLAWKTAGAPAYEINDYAVGVAIDSAEKIMVEKISEPAFYDLSDDEQEYLVSLVALGERGTASAISSMSGMSERQTRRVARRLELSGYILRGQDGRSALSSLVPKEVVLKESGMGEDSSDELFLGDEHDIRNLHQSVESGSLPVAPCRQWMPRAKSYCVLRKGHSGGCRSR